MQNYYYERWCEIQFYNICKNTFNITNDYRVFNSLAQTLSHFKNFNMNDIKEAFSTIVVNPIAKPNKDEFIILAHYFKYPISKTKALLNMSNKYYYSILEKYNNDKMGIYPKITKTELTVAIQGFVEAYHIMQEVLM